MEDTIYTPILESQLTKKQKNQLKQARKLLRQRGYKFAELIAIPVDQVTKEVLEFWFIDTTMCRYIFIVVDGDKLRLEEDSVYNILDKAEELKSHDKQH